MNKPQEKAMAPHSSTLAWKIPWTEEPGIINKAVYNILEEIHDSEILERDVMH